MSAKEEELRSLLKNAEIRMEQVLKENDSLSKAYHELMESQKGELDQMIRLSEQIWVLEDALAKTVGEKNDAIASLLEFKEKFAVLRKQAEQTLEAAASNASQLELAARVYEIAAEVRAVDDLDRRVARYNASLTRK